MCIGVPMAVVDVEGTNGVCQHGDARERVDLSLLDAVQPGQHVLVFLGRAVELLSEQDSNQISDALAAVQAAQSGQPFEHLISDLVNSTPTLPPHLRSLNAEAPDDTSTY